MIVMILIMVLVMMMIMVVVMLVIIKVAMIMVTSFDGYCGDSCDGWDVEDTPR